MVARYDYGCSAHDCGAVFELERPMADRHKRARCPVCRATATLLFTPSGNNVVPGSFATRWADVAPLDGNGKPMSFTETVKSGKFDKYRPDAREESEKAAVAHEAKMEPIIRKRAKDAAWKKIKTAEKRGTKVKAAA
jgi:putative FmdB family regulatory protein